MPRKFKDHNPEQIRYMLNCKGWTFAEIDRSFSLKTGIARLAARYPHIDGELAIAEILGLSPRQIWPSRFDCKSLKRLKPQPSANYKPKPRFRHCLKSKAA